MAKKRTFRKPRSPRQVFLHRVVDVLILVVVLWLAFTLAGRSLRRLAISQIADLTNAKIKARPIDFKLDGSVSIEKLVISPPQSENYEAAIFKAEKVYARFDVGSLLLMRPRLREITLNDFVFNAQYDLDEGQWNTTGLKFNVPKHGARHMPVVRLDRGTLQYTKVSKGQVKVVTKVPVDATLEPAEKAPGVHNFSITTAEMRMDAKSSLRGTWQPGMITIAGGISPASVPVFGKAWDIKIVAAELIYEPNNIYSLKLRIKDFIVNLGSGDDTSSFNKPSFLEGWSTFNFLQRFVLQYRPAGRIDIDLDASGSFGDLKESELNGKVYCRDVSICDCNFPYRLEHIVGEVDFDENRISLNSISGEHNDVNVTVNGYSKDFEAKWQSEIRIKSNNMVLDKDLYDALDPNQKEFWSAFSPSGLAAIDFTLSRQSQTERTTSLEVELLGAEATYNNFPYPLKNLNGKMRFDHNSITISDLISQHDGRKISLNGKVTEINTDRPIYDVLISAKDVPLDSELAAALSAKQKNFYKQLEMAGLVDAEIKIVTPEPNAGPTAFVGDVYLKQTSLKLEQLPIEISDVSAKAVVSADSITFENFIGRYGNNSVSLTGQIWPASEPEKDRYCLKVSAEQMEINDDLIELLPTSLKKIASGLKVKGKINLSADLNKGGVEGCPDHKLTVDCLGNSVYLVFAKEPQKEGLVTFDPAAYPLNNVTGSLVITTDSIKLVNITATGPNDLQDTANTSSITLNGEITLADNAIGGSKLQLSAHNLSFDEQLSLALPKNLRDLYAKLSPTGRFDLNLEDITMSEGDDGQRQIDFDGTANLKTCNFKTWPVVSDLNGVLETKLSYKSGGGFGGAGAKLSADSCRIVGKSINALKTNILYDSSRKSWQTENMVAECHGGRVVGKFELRQPDEGSSEYLLQAGFDSIDLKQFLADAGHEEQAKGDTSGKMSGSLNLGGTAGDNASRIGRCRLIITDMQVGQLSPLAKILYVLNLREPKDSAFEQMVVDSYIKGNRVFFEKFDLSGEAIAFNGSGWMDLKTKNVNLVLTVRGRRLAAAEPSVLQSLAEGLGGAVVRMEVTGNVYDPKVQIETLPVFKDSLKILGTKPTKPE